MSSGEIKYSFHYVGGRPNFHNQLKFMLQSYVLTSQFHIFKFVLYMEDRKNMASSRVGIEQT